MKENNSKYLIIGIIICVLLIVSLLALIISKNETKKINKSIIELKNSNYFLIQHLINNYYNENMNVYNLNGPTFIANNIYYNNDKIINYYFVNGYIIDRDLDGVTNYKKDINHLVIIKNGYYTLLKLPENINIHEYASNYELENIDINEYKLKEYYISTQNKLTFYIAVFKDLVEIDTEKAYTMLGENTLVKYANYDSFYNDRINILNNLSTYVNGYTSSENMYEIIDKKNNKTIITESSPMHFKIDF